MNTQQFDNLYESVDAEIRAMVAENHDADGASTPDDNSVVAHWLKNNLVKTYPNATDLSDAITYVISNSLYDDATMNKLFCIWHSEIRKQHKLANV